MGKGTKKKTVWRSFSLGDGEANGPTITNGKRTSESPEGQENMYHSSNGSSINGSWNPSRYRTTNKMVDYHKYNNNHINNKIGTTNSYHNSHLSASKIDYHRNNNSRSGNYFKRNTDNNYGTSTDPTANDLNEMHTPSMVPPSTYDGISFKHRPYYQRTNRITNIRNNYQSNGILTNYNRKFLRNHSQNYDNYTNNNNNNNDDNNSNSCSDNGNGRNVNDAKDKCAEKENNGVKQNEQQLPSFNEDEYTRITTPRSDVLFKKGYLSRPKKYETPAATASMSSNGSTAVSIVSTEETASYYSMQSISPENCAYNSSTYPTDGIDQDLSLMYPSGYYDNNCYFYVNPFVQNGFEQYNGQTILMPYGSPPPIDLTKPNESPYSTLSSTCSNEMNFEKKHSINSDEISASSLSENSSINHDSPSPSPTQDECIEKINKIPDTKSNSDKTGNIDTNEKIPVDIEEDLTTPVVNAEEDLSTNENVENVENVENDGKLSQTLQQPNFHPFIFVPPLPLMAIHDGPFTPSRRNGFTSRFMNNRFNGGPPNFGRYKSRKRFSHRYSYYPPTIYHVAAEESVENGNECGDNVETNSDGLPTEEQCDKILNTTKLNSNVSEFVPQSQRMIFIPLSRLPPPPLLQMVPLSNDPTVTLISTPTESTLNADVPEFHPRNYVPKYLTQNDNKFDRNINEQSIKNELNNDEQVDGDNKLPVINRNHTNEKTDDSNILKSDEIQKIVQTIDKSIQNSVDHLTKSNFKRTDNKKQLSHINSKADLVDKHSINISNCNQINSGSMPPAKFSTSKGLGTKRRENVWTPAKLKNKQIDVVPSIQTNSTKKTSDKEINENSIKIDVKNESEITKVENNMQKSSSVLTYAQMLAPINSKLPVSVVALSPVEENVKKNLKVKAHSNTQKSGNKSKYSRKEVIENGIDAKVKVNPEWLTVRTKGRKKQIFIESDDKQEDLFDNTIYSEHLEESMQIIAPLKLNVTEIQKIENDALPSVVIKDLENAKTKKTPITTNGKTKKKASSKKIAQKKENQIGKYGTAFDIIEPEFKVNAFETAVSNDNENAIETDLIDVNKNISSNELIFDPSIFASQSPMLTTTPITTGKLRRKSNHTNFAGLNHGAINLLNQFDIYQQQYNSNENLLLKVEEEMVIRVLEQLNKSEEKEKDIELAATKSTEDVSDVNLSKGITSNTQPIAEDKENTSSSSFENDAERFGINAKPYQNLYAPNHFLGHFFGDKDDKRKDPNPDEPIQQQVLNDDNVNKFDASEKLAENEKFCCNENAASVNGDATQRIDQHLLDNEINVEHLDHYFLMKDLKQLIDSKENIEPDQINVSNVSKQIENDCSAKKTIESSPSSNEETDLVNKNSFDSLIQWVIKSQSNEQIDNSNNISNKMITKPKEIPTPIDTKECNTNKIPTNTPTNNDEKIILKVNGELDTALKVIPIENNEFKSEKISNGRPKLRIVDTNMLEKQKKIQRNFPITTAVSLWLDRVQKEKTPDPILRLPYADCQFFTTQFDDKLHLTTKRIKKHDSRDSTDIDCYSTDDSASINNDDKQSRNHLKLKLPAKRNGNSIRDATLLLDLTEFTDSDDIDDDDDEDILNFWELNGSPSLLTPQSPTPPIYNSVYGHSINYANLLSNKNEILCDNIINYDATDESDVAQTMPTNQLNKTLQECTSSNCRIDHRKANEINQNDIKAATSNDNCNNNINNNNNLTSYSNSNNNNKPPEVCCILM